VTQFGIGIVGCAGRMGRMLVETVTARADCRVASGSERPGSPAIGQDIGRLAGTEPLGVAVTDDSAALFAAADAVLDFSSPAATVANAAAAAEAGKIHVIGTTGLAPEHQAAIAAAARRTAIVQAPNMSLGVNLLMALVRQAASRLGPDWDIDILEMHHRHKVDAPSGTALGLGRAAASGRGVALDSVARRTRDGLVGARPAGEIGFATLRGGDVVGDHLVVFAAEGERLELGHRAGSRVVFARGALHAALWARGKPPGLYGMADVLDLPQA
jgi:4-hydroxy-tetrahydrodipicolinate reductase